MTKGDLTRSIAVEAQGEVAALKDNINEMIRNLQGHDAEEHRAGLAEDQPRASSPACCRASATCSTVAQADPLGAGAAGRRAARRLLRRPSTRRRRADAQAARQLRATASASSLANAVQAGRGAGRPVRAREGAHPAHRRAGRLHPDQLRPRRGARRSTSSSCRCCSRARSRRSSSWPRSTAFSDDPPDLPRPAHRVDRHRAQHDRGEHADRGAAQAVAGARRRAAEPAGGADRDQRAAGAAGDARCRQSEELLKQPAGGAAADQRGAGGEGAAARRAEARRSSARTARSSRPARRSRRRPSSSRSPRSTSPSSSPTCRTSCARRSTAC